MSDPAATPNGLPSMLTMLLAAITRHLMTALAGVLVTAGALQTDQQESFVGIGVGICVFLAGLAWSAIQKQGVKTAAATQDPPR